MTFFLTRRLQTLKLKFALFFLTRSTHVILLKNLCWSFSQSTYCTLNQLDHQKKNKHIGKLKIYIEWNTKSKDKNIYSLTLANIQALVGDTMLQIYGCIDSRVGMRGEKEIKLQKWRKIWKSDITNTCKCTKQFTNVFKNIYTSKHTPYKLPKKASRQ